MRDKDFLESFLWDGHLARPCQAGILLAPHEVKPSGILVAHRLIVEIEGLLQPFHPRKDRLDERQEFGISSSCIHTSPPAPSP
ncbi:MAG: hypothetical protein HC899_02000 [Leptolyngbyaceae cyanobacterium SM1_4_3]|nr:hypothetical protein [Leptolyngbyaceae cyanobacterium SM1_4_3]